MIWTLVKHDTYSNIETVVGALSEQMLICSTKGEWLKYITCAAIPLEHCMVDHVSKVCAYAKLAYLKVRSNRFASTHQMSAN